MNRWRSRLAEIQDGSPAPLPSVQIVQIVQRPPSGWTFEQFEQFEHAQAGAPGRKAEAWGEVEEERAAIAEYDGGAPRKWAEALARLDPARPPGDVPPKRWVRFIDDAGRFLDDGWANRAAELGWGPLNLFGCDRYAPFARVDHSGLLWLLDGNTLIDLQRDKGVVQFKSGSRQTYYRCPVEVGRVVLAWELNQ